MKYILKYKLFLFIIGILFLQSFSIVAADNTYTMGGSSNQLRIALSSGGKWNIYRETVGGNNTWVKQFYGDADVFTIKIGATSIRSTAMAIEDISATTSGVSQVVSKKYTGMYESNSFSVILNFNYNTSNPSYMTLQAIVGATAIPSGTSISLAYGFDAYVNGCDGGAAITVPDISYNTVDQSVNLSQAQVQGLRMIGGINSNYTGSLIAFFPMGKPFDRAYSACYTSAYSYQVINQATNSNLFKFGPYAVPSCSGGCSSNPWDNGIGVVYDNIVAGQTTDLRTGLSFTQDLDGELDYTWNGSKNLVANLGDNINLNLKYISYNAQTLSNVGFKVNLPGLKISSGGCTQSGFNSGNFGCVVGNEYYQLTNGNINSLATANMIVPVQITQCGQWSIDGDAISDMSRTLPLGTPAVLTVKSTVGLASTTNIGICKGGSSIITVKLPDGVTPAHPITVALSYTGSTSSFTSLPTSVIIPAGQNSATFTIVSNASATDNSSLQVTLASTNQEFATINTAKTVAINLYNTPTVTNTLNNQTICSGILTSVISLTSSVTGATFTWTNTNTAIGLAASGTGNIPAFTTTNTTANPITATIRVTPTANGCAGTYKEYTITVNPAPTISTVLNNLTYCNKVNSPAIALASVAAGTTYTWTNTNTAIGLAASGTGNIPTFTATNTTANPITATIRVTPTANGCVGTYKEYTITVNPTPTVSTVLNNQTYCNAVSSPAITLASATTGTTYAWTNSNITIGLAASGTGNIPTFTATNTTANPISATIRVTPTANGCVGTYKEYTITVNPTPTVSTVLNNQTYCNAVSSPAITLASATTGTTYAWTNSNTAIGLAASGTGNIPTFTATNTTANPITSTIRVTPTANGCVGTYKEYTITVNPTPTVSTILNNQTYCNAVSSPAITLASATTGTTYAWTNSNTAIGLAASGTGNIPTFTATNTTANPISATIRVTPTANGCVGTYKEYTITVNPTPTVSTVLNNQTYCNAVSSPAITLASATTGTTYAWTNSNTAIGLAASGAGNIPTFTATNTTANPITATIRVTPTANGCVGTYKEYTITVNPTPTVSTVLNNQTYCNAVSSPAITLASATTGTTYAWTNSNTAIGLAASGTGNIPIFTATNTTANPITATIRVTPTANGCTGTYKEYTITVRPVVVIGAITGNPYACEGDIPQTIKGIATIGGTGTFTYQWQQSINNTTWTNISGATGLDYTPGVLTQSTYFKRISIDANCGSFESNSFLITKVAAGVKFTWKSTAIDNNWNNPDNWINTGGLVDAVPTKCSDVHIPSVSNRYPALDENTMRGRFGDPVTDKITFHFGGQVAYPHKLTYNKAFVQYNWGYYAGGSNEQPGGNLEGTASKMITRDRWYMLAAPLKKMASGDFALGGYPITWQSLYNAPHPSTGALVEGDFSTAFSSNDIDLSTKNNALAVKVACYNSNIGYSDQRHLESLQGILEIPYFENSTVANYHPGHVYNKIRKESRFYYFDEKTLQQLASPIGTLARGDEAYRFVFEDENTNKAPNIVVNGVTVPGYTHRVTSGASNDKTVMIGNPFMATINSRLFFEANRTKLKEDAGYYMLTPTNQVWSRYEYKTENKVPALQAIVITLADGLTSADLVYPLEGTYALTEVSNQTRSVASLSDDSGSSLYIRATDGSDKTSDYAILNAEETGESSGISKMIYPASHSVTEAFIVSSDQEYNLIDFYNGKRTEVGLGIKSSNQKDVLTLEFENVESFKHATGFSPVLIDRYLNVEQDLSSNNVYRFNQRKTESERQYSDVNRFSLRLSSATSGIIDETNSDDLIRVTYLTSQLEVTCSLGLVQVDVYDLQGRYLHTSGNLTEAPVTYTKYLPLSRGVYIVKVKTSQGQIVAKKINAL